MKDGSKTVTRRNFLKAGAAAGVSVFAGASMAACAPGTAGKENGSETLAQTSASETDWLGQAPVIAGEDVVEEKSCDMLIVGAGNAGLVAATTAMDLGIDFILCEKNTVVATSPIEVGAVNSKRHAEAGIEIDKSKLLNEMTRYASGNCSQKVWSVWINESGETIDYIDEILGNYGGNMSLYPVPATPTGGTDFYAPPTEHGWFGETGDIDMLQNRNGTMEMYLNDGGHSIAYEHTLLVLVSDDNGVSGAYFETPGGIVKINAQAVVLATGGYAANHAMVRALDPVADACVTADSSVPHAQGEGIKAGLWAGGHMDEHGSALMIFDRGVVPPGVDAGFADESPDASFPGTIPQFTVASQPFMKVNRRGRRFANESSAYDFMSHAASRQPGGVYCVICDSKALEDMRRFNTVGCSRMGRLMVEAAAGDLDVAFANEIEAGVVMKADTISELAQKLQLPEEAFAEEVEKYNAYFEAQVDEEFGKEPHRLSSIDQAPYYGFWCGGSLLTTLNGLSIDEDMRVLNDELEVIPGLYAIGDCAGSLYFGNYPELLVGNAAGRGVTFGRHVARFIADNLK